MLSYDINVMLCYKCYVMIQIWCIMVGANGTRTRRLGKDWSGSPTANRVGKSDQVKTFFSAVSAFHQMFSNKKELFIRLLDDKRMRRLQVV